VSSDLSTRRQHVFDTAAVYTQTNSPRAAPCRPEAESDVNDCVVES